MKGFSLNDVAYLKSVEETAIVRDRMILHLDPGNRNSYRGVGTTVVDLSGAGYNGTINGTLPWYPYNGGVFYWNGGNNWIDTTLNIDGYPNTICAWFYCMDVSQARGVVLTDNGGWDKGFGVSGGQWEIHGGDIQGLSSTNAPVNNKWYFGACVYSTTDVLLYINGFNQVYSRGSVQGANSGEPVEIGRAWYNGGAGSRQWNGYIASVQIYNRVLSANEINQNYNAMKWRYNL